MPGLHDELIVRFDVAEDHEFDVRRVGNRKDFVDGGQVAAEQAFPSLRKHGSGEFGEVLIGMVGARVAAGVYRHGVPALLGADECVPRTYAASARSETTGRRSGSRWRLGRRSA